MPADLDPKGLSLAATEVHVAHNVAEYPWWHVDPAHCRMAPLLARAAIRAYLDHLTAQGMVIVPREANSDQLDRAVAFALQVKLSADYGWSAYMRDLYGRFMSISAASVEG